MLEMRPSVGWLEVHSENYLGGGEPLHHLEALRRDYPISLHGVGLSLGTDGALDREHLGRIAELARHIDPVLISEHLSWSILDGIYLNDLLPLPYTEEALQVVCGHVGEMQEALVSYLRFAQHQPVQPVEVFQLTNSMIGDLGLRQAKHLEVL